MTMRNWIIVRAILLGESLERWDQQDVLDHYAFCMDRHLLNGTMVTDTAGKNVSAYPIGSTAEGYDFAGKLVDWFRLERALDEIDRAGLLPDEELLFETLAKFAS